MNKKIFNFIIGLIIFISCIIVQSQSIPSTECFFGPILQTAFEIGKRSNVALSCVCGSILFLAGNPTITKEGLDSPAFSNSNVQLLLVFF